VLANFELFFALSSPVIAVQQTGSVGVMYFRRDTLAFRQYFSSVAVLPFLSTLAISLLYFLFSAPLSKLLEIPEKWILLIPLIGLGAAISNMLITYYISAKKPVPYLLIEIPRTVLRFAGALFLILVLKWDWEGMAMALLITHSVMGVASLVVLRRLNLIGQGISWADMRDGLIFGLPLVLHTVSQNTIDLSNRVFITRMVGLEANGIYSVAYKVSVILLFVWKAFQQAWTPYFYERLKQNTESVRLQLTKVIYAVIGLLLVGALGLAFIGKYLVLWFMDPAYLVGTYLIPYIVFGIFFQSLFILMSGFLLYHKKSKPLASITIGSAVINLILNYVLINEFDALGAALSNMITYGLGSIAMTIAANKVHRLPWLFFLKK